MADPLIKAVRPSSLRLTLPCDLGEVRRATLAIKTFLQEHGLSDEALMPCELSLAEACNNAVKYVTKIGAEQPIILDALWDVTRVELRITDHTLGMDWPEHFPLPENECEGGRGIFLIHSLMDDCNYYRGRGENVLVLRKNLPLRPFFHPSPPPSVPELTRKLTETDQIISEMAKELTSCYESLSAIFRCSAEQGKSIKLEDFSERLLTDLLQITSADWFVLRLVQKDEAVLTVYAASEENLHLEPLVIPRPEYPLISSEAHAALSRQDVGFDHYKPLNPADPLWRVKWDSIGVVHPFFVGKTLLGTLTVGKSESQTPFNAAQVNVVHTFADFLAIQIVNTRFQEEQVNSRVVSRELEIANSIQRSLLPTALPEIPGFQLAGFCESARQVGGDFYDVIKIHDHSLLLIIADVMGKGIPAAMFAAILRSLVRAMPELISKPAALLERINRLLFEDLTRVEMFITAQLGFVDGENRRLVTASAGHCPAIVATDSPDDLKTLSPEGMPLGILPDTTFSDLCIDLKDNCRVLLYTDGLTEARNPEGELFGEQRLIEWFRKTKLTNAEHLKEELAAELDKFQSNATLNDDQTFIILTEAKNSMASPVVEVTA